MKKILTTAAIIVAVVLVAALVVPIAFRGKITQIVKREANDMLRARLDFAKLDISLLRHFPNASLDLKRLTLIGKDRFEGDTIASVDRISVVVDVMSLFGDEGFEVKKVIVARPTVHAHKLADGAVNWDVVKPSEDTSGEKPETAEPSSFKLRLRDLRISDAAIRYEDDSTGMRFSASPAGLRLRGDMSAEQTDFNLQLNAREMRVVSGGMTLLSGAEAELNAVIAADLKRNRFLFSENTLRLNAIVLGLDGWIELRDKAVAMDLKAGCDKVLFKDVLSLIPAFYTRDFRNLTASGELSMSLWARGEMRESTFPSFELKLGVKEGSFQYTSLPKAVTDIDFSVRIANPGGVMDRTEVDVPAFGFKMAGNQVAASLYGTNFISDPTFRAAVRGRFDLGSIGEVYPLEKGAELSGRIFANVKVSGRMSDIEGQRYEQIGASGAFVLEALNARMEGLPAVHIRRAAATITPAAMTLGELDLKVGQSDLAANGQLSGYIGYLMQNGTLSGRLYVKSDLLDLNEIMGNAASPQQAADTSSGAADTLTLRVPKNLNLSLKTELHKILLQKMIITDLTGEVSVAGAAVVLEHLGLQIFGGTATASGYYSTAADPQRPLLKLGADIAGASFSRTFEELDVVQKLVPIFAKTGGDYSMALDLTTGLDAQMAPETKTLNASGEIRSSNIRIQNIDAFDALAKALNNDALRRVEAKDVAIRFDIHNGRIATQPFDLKLGGATINLAGSTGLDQSIDYKAVVSLPAAATGGLLSKVDVGIGGTFSAPKITLGVKQAAEEALKNVIDRQVEKLTGSKTLGDQVQKQAARLREEAAKAGDKLIEAAEAQRVKLIEATKNPLTKLAAEKAGDKLVAEARKQAANLKAEAEKQIDKLTAKKE